MSEELCSTVQLLSYNASNVFGDNNTEHRTLYILWNVHRDTYMV